MRNTLFIIAYLIAFTLPISAQTIMKKGKLKIGITVAKEGKELLIDSLCRGFDPITNVPIDLVVPLGSYVDLITEAFKNRTIGVQINNQEPNYINQPPQKYGRGFSMSASAGSTNSYSFVDETKQDTISIKWTVAHEKLELLDLYPADYLKDYISLTYQKNFEKYPDTIRYDWSKTSYIDTLDKNGIPITPSFPHDHAGLLFVAYLTEEAVIKLEGYHDQFYQLDTENPFDLLLYEDLEPGTYVFVAKPYADAPERLWLRYPFLVELPWWKTQRTQFLFGILITILSLAIIVYFILNAQKRKEKEIRWQQQLTDAELKAIRAQLNPHFLFNALTSIQNLVSQQENDRANLYITKLSRLLRKVLSNSENRFQGLEEELRITQLYLELEQLRFPFSFQIEVSQSVDQNALVPVMLLQPYVENAVKHGIAGQSEGQINIKVHSDHKELYFEIVDNGPGLSNPNKHSKGIELGKNQINKLYSKAATISIKNRENESGVIVNISLPTT